MGELIVFCAALGGLAVIGGAVAWAAYHTRGITIDWRLEWDQPGEANDGR